MTGKRGFIVCLGRLTIFFLLSVPANAAEESSSAAAFSELFKWINFAIVAGLIIWALLKLTPPAFRKNAESIGSAINKAAAAKAEADRQLREAEEKLSRLQEEVAQLRATAQSENAAEAERIRAVTKSDAEKVALAAKAELKAAERAARLELKGIAANLAVDGAESLLAKELTPQRQESLVAAFVQSLEGRPN